MNMCLVKSWVSLHLKRKKCEKVIQEFQYFAPKQNENQSILKLISTFLIVFLLSKLRVEGILHEAISYYLPFLLSWRSLCKNLHKNSHASPLCSTVDSESFKSDLIPATSLIPFLASVLQSCSDKYLLAHQCCGRRSLELCTGLWGCQETAFNTTW